MEREPIPRQRWIAPLALIGGALFLVTIGWQCPLHSVTGVPCPTCGMTRALRDVFHGDVYGATAKHPLVWIVVPFVAVCGAIEVTGYVRRGTWGTTASVPYARWMVLVLAILVFGVWVARFFGAFGGFDAIGGIRR